MNLHDDLLCLPSWHHGKHRKLPWKSHGILIFYFINLFIYLFLCLYLFLIYFLFFLLFFYFFYFFYLFFYFCGNPVTNELNIILSLISAGEHDWEPGGGGTRPCGQGSVHVQRGVSVSLPPPHGLGGPDAAPEDGQVYVAARGRGPC